MDHLNVGPMTYELRILYRDALIVAFQCVFNLRRRNLVSMVLGRNLIVEGDLVRLNFKTADTKNHTPISWLLPDFIKPYLLRYLGEHRPVLLGGAHSDYVWISRRHTRLSYGAIPPLFDSIGRRLLGYPIARHCFRHSMATTMMTKGPT